MGIKIVATGSAVGSLSIDNDNIASRTGVPAEEVLEKTGIEKRFYINPENESALTLASTSVNSALKKHGSLKFDSVICATFGHEYLYPSLSSRIMADIGITADQVFDIQSNCTGFLNALLIGHDKLATDSDSETVLIIASEVNSYFMDSSDIGSIMFWGDGAGALTLVRDPDSTGGLLARAHSANFENNIAVRLEMDLKKKNGRIELVPIHQDGLASWRQATTGIPQIVKAVLSKANLAVSEIDYFIFHQANLRMLEYLGAKMRLPIEKVPTNVAKVGNMGAASIPILLDELNDSKRLKPGDKILFAAIGAGFSFTAIIWEW